ncbi:MAG: 2-oxo acid dehydrogenase subunit E2 [Acidimicrobiia bacterium]|nr:2-oxo acid dehydrogenase subunit E2 [Acidimicrobiia bacterium]
MSETQTTNGESATGSSSTGGSSTGSFVVKVPDVGEGVAEVEIVSWSVGVGDTVARLQTVAEVMTDKATVEVPSPVDGVVAELGGAVGDVLLVGSPLIRLGLGGGSGSPRDAQPAAAKPPPPERPRRQSEAADREADQGDDGKEEGREEGGGEGTAEHEETGDASAVRSTPRPPGVQARPHATGAPMSSNEPQPARGATSASTRGRVTPPSRTLDGKVLATPAVRRRARENGLDLRRVGATGPAGRVTHQDLDAYLAAHSESGIAVGGPPGAAVAARVARTGVTESPLIGLRRRIAQQMVASTSTIPHITYVEEVDMTALEELRATLNRRVQGDDTQTRLTLLPFLVRALTNVLADFPQFNAHLDDSEGGSGSGDGGPDVLRVYESVHVGIATQTDNGLIVPVLRHAEAHTVWSAANAIAEVTEATRTGRASAEDLSGSTITISSLGALGGIVSTPVINKPEVAVVGVNKMAVRPVWNEAAGQFTPRKMMNLSSSFDHRVIDGWDAANFVQALRAQLEQPALLFVDPIPGDSP